MTAPSEDRRAFRKIAYYCVATHLGGAERSMLDLITRVEAQSVGWYRPFVILPQADGPLVDAEVAAFSTWQDEYLAALRESDVTETQRLVDELSAAREHLQTDLVGSLATLRTEVDGRILDLANGLDHAIQLVP